MKKLLFFAVVAAAFAGGVYLWRFAPRSHSLSEGQLTFANVEQTTMRDVVSATGLLEPREIILVGSEMPGVARVVSGKANQSLPEATILLQLDDRKLRLKKEEADNGVRTAKAALAQAEAIRDAARIALNYQIDLASKGGIRSDKEQAEAQLKAAAAGITAAEAHVEVALSAAKEAQLALDMAIIRVPGKGDSASKPRDYLILESKVHEGQMVGPQGGPLFVLAGGLDRLELHALVAEGDINRVRVGQTAVFNVSTYADEKAEFRGLVKEIRPQATNAKGAAYYDTVIEVANQKDRQSNEWQLRPGMNVSVDILRVEHRNVWSIPAAALNFQLDDAYQSAAVRARLGQWSQRADRKDWQTLWVWDTAKSSPWPLFARVGGLKNGEPGLKDSEGIEVLEWEPDFEPSSSPPRVIISAPSPRAPGFFDKPANIKVS